MISRFQHAFELSQYLQQHLATLPRIRLFVSLHPFSEGYYFLYYVLPFLKEIFFFFFFYLIYIYFFMWLILFFTSLIYFIYLLIIIIIIIMQRSPLSFYFRLVSSKFSINVSGLCWSIFSPCFLYSGDVVLWSVLLLLLLYSSVWVSDVAPSEVSLFCCVVFIVFFSFIRCCFWYSSYFLYLHSYQPLKDSRIQGFLCMKRVFILRYPLIQNYCG